MEKVFLLNRWSRGKRGMAHKGLKLPKRFTNLPFDLAGTRVKKGEDVLTALFFETGAMSTPTKSQNPTNCG